MNNHNIRTADFTRSLPLPLKKNNTEFAIAKAVSGQLQITANLIKNVIIYARIDELDENILDTMARFMNIVWYKFDVPVETKRKLLKESMEIYKKLGTVWAVERVLSIYYGKGTVEEWFDYGGSPGYFRISTYSLLTLNSLYEDFMRILNIVKRKTAWLESITVYADVSGNKYTGAFVSSYGQCRVIAEFIPQKIELDDYHISALVSSYRESMVKGEFI